MGMRRLLTSKHRSSSSSFRNSGLALGSADLSSRYTSRLYLAHTNTSSQTGSSAWVTSEAIYSNTEQTSFSPTTTEACQNPTGMTQFIISKSRSSSSSRTSNISLRFTSFSSRSTRRLDREGTHSNSETGSYPPGNPFEQLYGISELFKHSPEDLFKAGIVKKAKTPEEFEIMREKDLHDVIQLFYNCMFYPAKVRNPKITNSWAVAHLDAPEIKELGIDASWLRFISQLEKSRQIKGVRMDVVFDHPIFLDIEEQRAYMKTLVASLE